MEGLNGAKRGLSCLALSPHTLGACPTLPSLLGLVCSSVPKIPQDRGRLTRFSLTQREESDWSRSGVHSWSSNQER